MRHPRPPGYGDGSVQGQIARAVVMVQMLSGVGGIATGGSLLLRRLPEQQRNGRRD